MRRRLWLTLTLLVLVAMGTVWLMLSRDRVPSRSVAFGFAGITSFSQGLAVVKHQEDHHQFGCISQSGVLCFQGEFSYLGSFAEGLAVAQRFERASQCYKFGYVDAAGQVVIDFQFDDAKAFSEGLAAVKVQGQYGYIDPSGTMVLKPEFDDAFPFSGSRGMIVVRGHCGFVDPNGQIVIPPDYYQAGAFSEGLAPVANRSKYGYIDPSGRVLIDFVFDGAKAFCGGAAPIKTGKKWSYIRKDGTPLSNVTFDAAEPFSEGLARVGVVRTNFYDRHFGGYSGTRMAYGFVDQTGRYAIKPKFLSAASFSDGLSRVSIPAGDWFGESEDFIFIDKQEHRVSPRLAYAEPFKDGLALVMNKRHKLGFINTDGHYVIHFETEDRVYAGHTSPVIRTRYGFIDTKGTQVIPPRFSSARPFSDGLAYVDEGKRGFINRKGERVITLAGTMLPLDFSEGLAAVEVYDSQKRESLCGYIDPNGDFVIPPQFYEGRSFGQDRAAVKLVDTFGNSWGYIDRTGAISIPAQFRAGGRFADDIALVEYGQRQASGPGEEIHHRFINRAGHTVLNPTQSSFNLYHSSGFPPSSEDRMWKEDEQNTASYFSFAQPLIPARAQKAPYKTGFVNQTGRFVIAPRFDAAKPFAEGLAPVKTNGRWGYIDLKGKVVISPRYDDAHPFSGQRALVEDNGRYGYIDPSGAIAIELQLFESASSFREGFARVMMNGQYGFIDETGRSVVEPQYREARSFSEGLAVIGVRD